MSDYNNEIHDYSRNEEKMTDENAIVPQQNFLAPVVSVQDALQAYQAKKELIEGILHSGVDFGTIPGSTKPALLKAGAEKMTSLFGLSTHFKDVETVEDWTGQGHGGEPFFYYRQSCGLYRGDRLIAEADGSCNSWEKKYRYRWVSEFEIPLGMDKSLLRSQGGKNSEFAFAIEKAETSGKYGKPPEYWKMWRDAIANNVAAKIKRKTSKGADMDAYEMDTTVYAVPNKDVAEQVNTILKMAQKRALVAATLIATGLSDYFTQDIDDFVQPGEIVDAAARPAAKEMTYEEAAAVEIEDKDKKLVRLDSLTQPQLVYLVEHSKDATKAQAAEIVLEKDFGMARPEA